MNTHQDNDDKQMRPDTAHAAEELAVGGTAVAPTALNGRVTHCLVSVKGNPVRVTFDGSAPVSAAAGHIFAAGNYFWCRDMVNSARFIESTGSAAATVRFQPMAAS